MILDTYTMMSWPDKGLEGALNEIKLRVDSLAINGSLVLVYPTDNTIERFSLSDKLPELFELPLDYIKKKIQQEIQTVIWRYQIQALLVIVVG